MKSIIFTILLLGVGFYFYGINFMATVLSISFLIFFHEFGHFIVARRLGVKVNVFSVGFGEKIWAKSWRGTEYRISAIPLGGYVSLKGQEDLKPELKNFDNDSYNSKSPFERILILFAGPFFNILLAFLIYIALGFIGVEKLAPKIGHIAENSAAATVGLNKNDEILSINGEKVQEWDDIAKNVALKPLNLEILRDGKIINVVLTPKIGEKLNIWREKIQTPLIGISPNGEFVTIYHTGISSLKFAYLQTIEASKLIVIGLEKFVSGAVSPKEMGGIVAITDITSKAVSFGISPLLLLIALISVNLGILNLFPIPALDGGHIFFNLYELIFRKPVGEKFFARATYAGIFLLFALMIFTVINDFFRIFGVYE